jgi:hypothetical protein
MAIGLGIWRSSGRRRAAGRAEENRESPRASVREVCLIGLDRRAPAGDWPAGREVNWLGRTYEVRASASEIHGPANIDADPARRYVHLAPRDGD